MRVIAIDGPAASGKSTTAGAVAARLGWRHLDSGALYRAATLAALDHLRPEERSGLRVRDLVARLPVRLVDAGDGFRVEVAGVDVAGLVRAERVNASVSDIAALPAVRDWATGELRRAVAQAAGRGVVVDGRDIGTAVFPEAPLKIFLTATPEARAARRLAQSGQPVDPQKLLEESRRLGERDATDQGRSVAPLAAAPDAVLLDTTGLSFEEQVAQVVALARKLFAS